MAIEIGKVKRRVLPAPPLDGNPAMEAPLPSAQAKAATTPTFNAPVADLQKPLDGRSLRASHRTTQLNIKVKAETRQAFLRIAERRGVMLSELFEEAVRLLEDSYPLDSR